MIKYVFLVIFIVFICFTDTSSLFLDESTKRLLYSNEPDSNDDDDLANTDADDSVSEKNESPELRVSVTGERRSGQGNIENLDKELQALQKSLNNAKSSGISVPDMEQVQSEFVDDIYSEWGGNGSSN